MKSSLNLRAHGAVVVAAMCIGASPVAAQTAAATKDACDQIYQARDAYRVQAKEQLSPVESVAEYVERTTNRADAANMSTSFGLNLGSLFSSFTDGLIKAITKKANSEMNKEINAIKRKANNAVGDAVGRSAAPRMDGGTSPSPSRSASPGLPGFVQR